MSVVQVIGKPPTPKRGFGPRITTADILADLPATKWLNRDLCLCPGRPSMFAAYGYFGKTITCQSMALSMASNRSIWDRFRSDGHKRVLHLDHEQGRQATLLRYKRLLKGHGIDGAELGDRLEVSVFPPVYLNDADAESVYARECEGVDFVFLDALRGATPGLDENDSKIRYCIDNLTRVSEKTGTTFMLIHHAGKPKEGHADMRTVARGSSAIFDACGTVLIGVGEKGAPKLVSMQKASAETAGGGLPDFRLTIEDVAVGDNPSGGVRVVHCDGDTESGSRPEEEYEEKVRRVYKYIVDNPETTSNVIAESIRMRAGTVRAAITTLLDRGMIRDDGDSRKHKLLAIDAGPPN